MVGTQADCRSVGGLGLFRPASGAQQDAEIAVRVRVAGVDLNGAFVLGDRIPESAVGLQNNPEIAMPVRLIRAEREALPDEVDGVIGSALLVRQQAGVVKSVWMVWRHIEHPGIELLCLGQVMLLLQLDRQRDGLVDRQLPRRPTVPPLTDLVGLQVELEVHPCVERSVGPLRLVLEVHLGELQADGFGVRLVFGAAVG